MSFTRRHYEEVARIIREGRAHEVDSPCHTHRADYDDGYEAGFIDAYREVGGMFSRMFAADNPRFDPTRFAMACEPKGAK